MRWREKRERCGLVRGLLFGDIADTEQGYVQLAASYNGVDEAAEGGVHLGGVLLDQALKTEIHLARSWAYTWIT